MLHSGELYSPHTLGHMLESGDPDSVFILDCRSPDEYSEGHIQGALHVVIPSIMLRRMMKKATFSVSSVITSTEGKDRFDRRGVNDLVILYDRDSKDAVANPTSIVSQLLGKLRADGCQAKLLVGGFESFNAEFPELCSKTITNHHGNNLSHDNNTNSSAMDNNTSFITATTKHPQHMPTLIGLSTLSLGDAQSLKTTDSAITPTKTNTKYKNKADLRISILNNDNSSGLPELSSNEHDQCPPLTPSTINNTNTTSSVTNSSNTQVVFPVQVLPYLFLGNKQNSGDANCLRKHRIGYIINVTQDVENKFENVERCHGDGCDDDVEIRIKYLQIPIVDHWSQNISQYFPAAIAFIDEARADDSRVLIHCLAGISRSVTVTVAYLMHALRLSMNEAYEFVQTKKPNISPNFNFMGQLLDFEQSLKVRNCQQCECYKDSVVSMTTSSGNVSSSALSSVPMAISNSSSSASSSETSSNSSPVATKIKKGTSATNSDIPIDTENNDDTVNPAASSKIEIGENNTKIIVQTESESNRTETLSKRQQTPAVAIKAAKPSSVIAKSNRTMAATTPLLSAGSIQCTCSCHDLKSFFSTPSSTTSGSSSSGGSTHSAPNKFNYTDLPT